MQNQSGETFVSKIAFVKLSLWNNVSAELSVFATNNYLLFVLAYIPQACVKWHVQIVWIVRFNLESKLLTTEDNLETL